jgi:hypothetical protein
MTAGKDVKKDMKAMETMDKRKMTYGVSFVLGLTTTP